MRQIYKSKHPKKINCIFVQSLQGILNKPRLFSGSSLLYSPLQTQQVCGQKDCIQSGGKVQVTAETPLLTFPGTRAAASSLLWCTASDAAVKKSDPVTLRFPATHLRPSVPSSLSTDKCRCSTFCWDGSWRHRTRQNSALL